MHEDDEDDDDRPRKRRKRRRDHDDEYEDDEYEDDLDDDDDEAPRRRRRRRSAPTTDPEMEFIIPMNTSVLAIFAGYVGLISVLCVPAPFALLLGVLALVQMKKNPELHGRYRAIFAVVMGVLFTIPLIVLGIALIKEGLK